jgi:hypothetical protein
MSGSLRSSRRIEKMGALPMQASRFLHPFPASTSERSIAEHPRLPSFPRTPEPSFSRANVVWLKSPDPACRTNQPPLMPAYGGIQPSRGSRMRLKRLDSRVRGNERVGRFAVYRLGQQGVGRAFARPNRQFPHGLVRGHEWRLADSSAGLLWDQPIATLSTASRAEPSGYSGREPTSAANAVSHPFQ